MSSLRIVDGLIELDGQRVARLLPGLAPTLVYRLEVAFDALDEAADELNEEIERLIRAMGEGERARSLAARMARARMRLVVQGLEPDERPTWPSSGEPL